MAKIKTEICLDPDNYMWIREESTLRKHKSLSITINELIKNYQYLIRTAQKSLENQNKIENNLQKEKERAEGYKEQIVLPYKQQMPPLDDWMKKQQNAKIIKDK